MMKTEEGAWVRLNLSFRLSDVSVPREALCWPWLGTMEAAGGPVVEKALPESHPAEHRVSLALGGLHYFTLMTNLPAGFSRWGNKERGQPDKSMKGEAPPPPEGFVSRSHGR